MKLLYEDTENGERFDVGSGRCLGGGAATRAYSHLKSGRRRSVHVFGTTSIPQQSSDDNENPAGRMHTNRPSQLLHTLAVLYIDFINDRFRPVPPARIVPLLAPFSTHPPCLGTQSAASDHRQKKGKPGQARAFPTAQFSTARIPSRLRLHNGGSKCVRCGRRGTRRWCRRPKVVRRPVVQQ